MSEYEDTVVNSQATETETVDETKIDLSNAAPVPEPQPDSQE